MKEKNTKSSSRLELIKELYESAVNANSEYMTFLERQLSQYLGSTEIDGSDERAGTVRNITYELIESEINPDIPQPKVDGASYSERRERNARSIERLCTAIKERLPFEVMNDADERYTYIFGGSIFYVEWDGQSTADSVTGGIKIHCISPLDFIPQPGISEIEDMEYCFLRFTTTKGELMSKYRVREEELPLADCEYEYGAGLLSDTVSMTVAFYRGERGEVGKFVFSGDLILSDIPNYYSRKLEVCKGCGKRAELCSCSAPEHMLKDIFCESVSINGKITDVPYYLPKRFPIIIRKNTASAAGWLGSSDCEQIRPQQQAINKVESRILQKLLRAGITPVMPEGTSVSLSNAVFGQVIKMRPGETLDSYGKIDTTPDISQDIAEAQRLYDHAKRILGISDAYQGLDNTSSESGYARQLKISQAGSRLETKRRLKYHAYSELYRLIFEHYLAFADEPRPLAYRDPLGNVHLTEFSRYDFLDTDGALPHYDDAYLFSVDRNSGGEYTREELWQRNLSNLEAGTLGDKESPVTLLRYWQSQERAHYPYARENVEYFKDIVESMQNTKEKEEIN